MELNIIGLIFLKVLFVTAHTAVSDNNIGQIRKEPLNFVEIIENLKSSSLFNGSWISSSEISYVAGDSLMSFDVLNQQETVIAKNAEFLDVGSRKFELSPDKNYILKCNNTESVYRHSTLSTCYTYNIKSSKTTSLGGGKPISTVKWGPKGSQLIYVQDNDIYHQVLTGDSADTRRITSDGVPRLIYNGVPDWVYEEEVISGDTTLWFSPNGSHLVFVSFNDTQVQEAMILRYGNPGSMEDQYPEKDAFRYPKSGSPNPTVKLNVVNLEDKDEKPRELPAPVEEVGLDHVLHSVRWFDNHTLVAFWSNRVQNVSQVVTYCAKCGHLKQHLLKDEVKDGWLFYLEAPVRVGDKVILVKFQSVGNDSLGSFGHVTRYDLVNDTLKNELDLTPGLQWVHGINSVDAAKRVVYYYASPVGKPSQKHLYAVSLDAPKEPKCVSCGIQTPEGNECTYVKSVKFSPDFSHYVLTCAGPDPAFIKVYTSENKEVFFWKKNAELRDALNTMAKNKGRKNMFRAKDLTINANGFDAKVRLLLPGDFNPSKKYPALVNVYAGPGSQRIVDAFAVSFETFLSNRTDVVHIMIDGRGTLAKGTKMMFAVYRNLGGAEIEDQIIITKKLQDMFSWIDRSKTAVWGHSYGGYATALILAKDTNDVFKCGISSSPTTDFIYYDSIYTERYMGLPTKEDNLKNYEEGSVLKYGKSLDRKEFFLIHGTGDDNVHYQHSMVLAKSLIQSGVMFQQFSYPDEAHSLKHVTMHYYRTMDKFISRCYSL